MNIKELENLKLEILKIEVKSLKVLSDKLDRNDYHKDIESILQRANELKSEINQLIQIEK